MPDWGGNAVASCLRAAPLKVSQQFQNTHFMKLFVSPTISGQLDISGFRPDAEMAKMLSICSEFSLAAVDNVNSLQTDGTSLQVSLTVGSIFARDYNLQ